MARQQVAPLKLAFFVEGDLEKDFIEVLVPRILGQEVAARVLRVGDKAAFSSTFTRPRSSWRPAMPRFS